MYGFTARWTPAAAGWQRRARNFNSRHQAGPAPPLASAPERIQLTSAESRCVPLLIPRDRAIASARIAYGAAGTPVLRT